MSARATRFLSLLLAVGRPAQTPTSVPAASLIEGTSFTVEWRDSPERWPDAEVEVGSASGHGGNLRLIRLIPREGEVEALSFEYLGPSLSRKEPPTVTATLASMTLTDFRDLLRDLAKIQAARLLPDPDVNDETMWSSTADFWASIRVVHQGAVRFEDEWCGYPSSWEEILYARAAAAVGRVLRSLNASALRPHVPTEEERLWVSRKCAHDWRRFAPTGTDYWWVRERLPLLVGAVGDDSSFALLQPLTVVRVRVLSGDGSALPFSEGRLRWRRPERGGAWWDDAIPRLGDPTAFVLVDEPGNVQLDVRVAGFQRKNLLLTVGPKTPQETVVQLEPGERPK